MNNRGITDRTPPHLYRMAADSMEASLKVLPRFALYNHLNPWGAK